MFETALLFEQEKTVGPKVKEEVAKFDCPVLTSLVLKPVVRFGYFPRFKLLFFRDFSDVDERIDKAVRSYRLAEAGRMARGLRRDPLPGRPPRALLRRSARLRRGPPAGAPARGLRANYRARCGLVIAPGPGAP